MIMQLPTATLTLLVLTVVSTTSVVNAANRSNLRSDNNHQFNDLTKDVDSSTMDRIKSRYLNTANTVHSNAAQRDNERRMMSMDTSMSMEAVDASMSMSMPKNSRTGMSMSMSMSASSDSKSCQTVPELLCTDDAVNGNFTAFCSAWVKYDSTPDGTPTTIFAPIDAGFANLGSILDARGIVQTPEDEARVFAFHIVAGQQLMAADLPCMEVIEMASGDLSRTKCGWKDGVDYKIQKGGGNRMYENDPFIVAADIEACDNIVVHVITEVMLPNYHTTL